MIKKIIRQMLTAQVLSALTVSLCLLIDNIMIGNFIGVDGLTAYGLANPLLLFIGAVGTMLSAGVQVVCSRSLGNGEKDETHKGYSSAIAVALMVALPVTALVVLFRGSMASFLGAHDPALLRDTGDYLLGFVVGALGSMGALILVPFLQMAGKSKLLICSVLGMTVTDIALDYIFSVKLGLGMLGMGLASSASYYVALLIGGRYFFTKACVFRFRLAYIRLRKILQLLRAGIPTVISMVTTVGLTFVMNRLLLATSAGADAVAAYSVVCTIGNAANCISTGSGGVALTLSSMFYHEEDRTGLREQLTWLLRYGLLMGLVMTGIILLIAPLFVSLFIPAADAASAASRELAILGARWFACGLTFSCVNSAIRSTWQGCERISLMELTSVLQGFLLPALAAFLLRQAGGAKGVWAFFLIGEAVTLLLIWLYIACRKHSLRPSVGDLLCLPAGFGVAESDLIETNVTCIDDVMTAVNNAMEFCLAHGQSRSMANKLGLCIEEMGTNVVTHGFNDRKPHQLNIRVQHKGSRWILHFRDDCRDFDPLSHIPALGSEESIGIRMLVGLSYEIRHTYSLSLNNLTIVIQ